MITIYDKNGLVRAQLEELSDSSIKEAVSDEEYASIQFKSNTLINFNVGDYVDIYSKRYWLMKVPAPIEKQSSIEYNYTIKFESSRAFLGYVNFELFDNTSIKLVPEYNNATSYTIGNVVTYRNLFWQCTQNCTGISPAENDYWSIKSTITNYVPPYNASTTYTYGNIVEYNNNYFMYIYGNDASGNIPKEGDHWTIIKTAPQWDFSTVLTPSRYAQLIVDNMRRARPDQDWVVGDCVAKSPLQASFSNVSCLDAASQIAELFETELYVDGFTINFKKKEQSTNISMKYGENGGFQNITRSEVTESSKVTRLVALGGTQNLLSSYRNGSTRLMLPNKYYIDSDNIDLILPIEKTVTWDNIFPCMSHATEDWDSTKTYYAGSQVTYNGYSWDALQQSINVTPITGAYWKISEGTITGFLSQYKFIDANLTFNPLDSQYIMADGTKPKVRFITGNLAGYDFPIAGYEPSTKTITIEQISDSKYSSLPTASYGMKQGDQYVFIDLYMPQSYVTKNENKLLASAQEYLSIYSRDQVSYSGDVDTIWATNNNINLHAGDLIHVIDEDFNINLEYRIVNVTRGLRNQYEYQITLSTFPRIATRIENIENKLNNVSSQTSNLISNSISIDILKKDDTRPATDSRVMSSLRTLLEIANRSLSRQHADKAAEIIDFLKGLTINGDKATIDKDGIATVQQLIALVKAQVAALEVTGNTKTDSLDVTETAKAKDVEVSNSVTTLNAVIQALAKTHDLTVENTADIMHGIIREYLTSESFVSGFLGSGFKIWKDEQGLWHGELDELTVRKTFLVFELVVQKIVHQGGMVIRSAAGGKLKKVTDGGTYWKCEHDSTDDFVVGDQVLCQTFTGTSMKRYWRLVTSAGAGYFNLSKSDCEAGSANPEAGDEVAILGNRTVTARQKAQIDCAVGDDAPYRDDYSGINSYSLVGKLINRTGNLSGITDPDFGALSGSGLYGINVYLKGIFRLLSGKTVEDAISDAQAESNAYTDGKITKIETSFEIREGQISSKVTEATAAATNAGNSATLAQGYASTATSKASAASNSASSAAGSATTAGQKASAAAGSAADAKSAVDNASDILSQVTTKESSINQTAGNITLQVQEVTTKVTTATNAANTATSKASEASTSAGTASTKASAAATSATNASNSASSAASSASAAANILTTVTQKETSIKQTADAIELKAVRAESAAGRAESAEASINLKADGIVLQASNQAAKTAVDGVQVGGSNLIRNGSKFTSTAYWELYNTTGVTIDYRIWNNVWSGYVPALNIHLDSFTSGEVGIFQDIATEIGQQYAFSCYIAGHRSRKVISIQAVGTSEITRWDAGHILGGNSIADWQKPELVFTATTTTTRIYIFIPYYTDKDEYIWLKDIVCVKGNKVTGWTPAPEDVAQDATNKANTAESNAKGYANNTFTTKTEFSSQLTILNNSISTKVSQTDFNSLGSRVGNAETTISQHTNLIALKASQSDLTALGSRVTSAEAKITSDAINLTVKSQTQTIAQQAADNIQVGGRNLASNTGFINNSMQYWNFYSPTGAATKSIVVESSAIGGLAIQYTFTSAGVCGPYYSAPGYVPGHLKVGSQYTVSCWIKTSVAGSFDFGLEGGYTYIKNIVANTWTYFSKVFTFTGTTNSAIHMYHNVSVPIGGIISVHSLKIEAGNKDTDWTPAPEDVDASLALRPTTDEIKSQFTIDQTGISILGKKIALTGLITFSSFDSSTQSTINGKATTGYVDTAKSSAISTAATDATTKANTAQNNAISAAATDAATKANNALASAKLYSDTLKNSLGSLAYVNTVSLAKLDTTIIEGGYIKTALINANAIITNDLLATKIAATDITTGRLTVTDGAKIGGWIVEGNALKINSAAGAKILVEPSGTRFLRINDSADALMAVRADGVTGISIYTQDTTGKCLRMTAQIGGTAIESYGRCQFKARTGELISLLGATSLGGIAINATSYSSTSVTLTNEDSFVMCKASDSMSVYMPSSPTDGKVIIICRDAHISVRIYGNGKYVRRGISNYSYGDIDEDGQMVILIYNGGYWYINYLNS